MSTSGSSLSSQPDTSEQLRDFAFIVFSVSLCPKAEQRNANPVLKTHKLFQITAPSPIP